MSSAVPMAQMSLADVPQIDDIGVSESGNALGANAKASELAPVPCWSPFAPPTQTSVGPLPQIACRSPSDDACTFHEAPSQRRTSPSFVAAQTIPCLSP